MSHVSTREERADQCQLAREIADARQEPLGPSWTPLFAHVWRCVDASRPPFHAVVVAQCSADNPCGLWRYEYPTVCEAVCVECTREAPCARWIATVQLASRRPGFRAIAAYDDCVIKTALWTQHDDPTSAISCAATERLVDIVEPPSTRELMRSIRARGLSGVQWVFLVALLAVVAAVAVLRGLPVATATIGACGLLFCFFWEFVLPRVLYHRAWRRYIEHGV